MEFLPFLHFRERLPSFPDFQRWMNSLRVANKKPASVFPSIDVFIFVGSGIEGAAVTDTVVAAGTANCYDMISVYLLIYSLWISVS